MMGFMSVTMVLSMFVSNTGACAMICPIVEALVHELFHRVTIKNVLNFEKVDLKFVERCRILKNVKMERRIAWQSKPMKPLKNMLGILLDLSCFNLNVLLIIFKFTATKFLKKRVEYELLSFFRSHIQLTLGALARW